jgi:hypothetical protein
MSKASTGYNCSRFCREYLSRYVVSDQDARTLQLLRLDLENAIEYQAEIIRDMEGSQDREGLDLMEEAKRDLSAFQQAKSNITKRHAEVAKAYGCAIGNEP